MSFVPEFAPDAKSQWRELDPVLQEMVLDELELLLANPPAPPKREFYHDFRHEEENQFHYVFLRVHVDYRRRVITIAGVIHHIRPKTR